MRSPISPIVAHLKRPRLVRPAAIAASAGPLARYGAAINPDDPAGQRRGQCLRATPKKRRLGGLLAKISELQNEVGEVLAGQVLRTLYELLRGFQAAHHTSKGALLAMEQAEIITATHAALGRTDDKASG